MGFNLSVNLSLTTGQYDAVFCLKIMLVSHKENANVLFKFNMQYTVISLTSPVTGYGHTAPLSDGGKAFCIIYSVIGIPFTLLFLTAVVQRIMVFSTWRPIMYIHTRWGLSKPVVALIHATLLAVVAVSCFFLIPAAIFSVLEENWNFLESFYFCFISLSTIGLGDYVPGEAFNQKFRELYKLGITGEWGSV